MKEQPLHQQLTDIIKTGGEDFFRRQVPSFIYQNLRPSLGKRAYQQEALGRFVHYFNEWEKKDKAPVQLLYHMATGSGKTVVMAGLILYLYQQGYRHFLFFVNSTTILEKTKDNFLNSRSSKYLFNPAVHLNGKAVKIRAGNNFETGNEEDIHLVFATIQGLHQQLNNPAENSITYEDFEDKKIVLLSDEAHHINAETKKSTALTADEKEELLSWEATVRQLFQSNVKNILLEFTATVDLSLPEIAAKYNDKIIFDYSLKQFRQDKYSKEVKVLQSDLPLFQRAMQAVLLSQYRYKLFQHWGLLIKPVILFKSKTIKESETFFDAFITGIKNMSVEQLQNWNSNETEAPIKKLFEYLAAQKVTPENFIAELQADFSEEKLVAVNSRDDSEKKQLAVNTLEDESNPYRAIFAVDKLNEGWDVLNLFDIVRCYDSADAAKGVLKKTTLSEAQLIGRGARYCPFVIADGQAAAQRKFDEDEDHELRIAEVLYYHSPYNPRYIHELHETLVQLGLADEKEVKKTAGQKQIIKNQQKNIDHSAVFSSRVFPVRIASNISTSFSLFNEAEEKAVKAKTTTYPLTVLPAIIVRKAMDGQPFFYFNNLKKYFPQLRSVTEFIEDKCYLACVQFSIADTSINELQPVQKKEIAAQILEQIKNTLL